MGPLKVTHLAVLGVGLPGVWGGQGALGKCVYVYVCVLELQ